MFDASSRYSGVGEASYRDAGGHTFVYKRRRFPPLTPATEGLVRVRDGERLDILAARLLGDPQLFWRLADANSAMDPSGLAQPGATLAVPLGGHQPQAPA